MAGIVKIIGWLATAVGVIFIILPFVVSEGLSVDTMVSLCIFLLVMGPLLVGLSQLIEVAEKIQANTSWFSTGGAPQGQAAVTEQAAAAAPVAEPEPTPEPEPEPTPEPEPEPQPAPEPEPEPAVATPPPPPEQPRERAVPRSERMADRPPAPQLYDANVHPAAVDEWTHKTRRVMTLEDGTFATEVDGAWYRFLKLDDIDALRS